MRNNKGNTQKKLRKSDQQSTINDVTEKKRAEEILKISEERYRSALDSMLEGCAILGFNWTYLYVNDANARHSHMKKEDMLGKPIFEVIPGVEKSVFFEAYNRCMTERTPQRVEAGFNFEDGSKAWYEALASPIQEGIFVMSIDITDRKQAEDELKKKEHILELILDHINEGIIVSDAPDGKVLAVSRWGLNHTVGRSVDAVIDLPVEKYLEQWDVRNINTGEKTEPERLPVSRALKGETIQGEEWLMLRPDGSSFITSVNAVPIYNNDKTQVLNTVATWTDITDKKKAEEQANQRLIELETILSSIADGVIVYDIDGKIVRMNTAAETILKYPQADRDSSIYERVKDRYGVWSEDGKRLKPDEMPAMLASKYGEKVTGTVVRVQGAGEPKWIYVSAAPLFVSGKQTGAVASMSDITERLKAEEALKLREAQLDAFFANSPAILNLVDENFCYLNTDKLTPIYYGLDRETIKGKCVKDLSQDFIEQTGKVMQHIIETGNPVLNQQFQAPVPGRGGEMAYWSTSMFRVPLGNEKWGVGVISLEITDIKRAEEALRESEERFVKAFNNSPYAMTITKLPEGIWTDVNESFMNLTGFSREELLGHSSVELNLVIEQTPEERRRIIKSLAETGSVSNAEMTIRTKYGEIRHIILSAVITKLKNEDFAITQHVDLTERKKAEREVRKAKEEYELLFNSIQEGFAHYKAVYDENGRLNDLLVLDINPEGARLSGVSRKEQTGRTWKMVWTGIEDNLFDIYREVDSKGTPFTFEHFSGITNRWYINNIYKISDGEFAVTFFDITDRKLAEINLEKTLTELERSNRDLERFAFAASHDLQEPIRMMGSYAHLMMKRYKGNLSPQADRYLVFMFEGALRLQLLIRDLLNYARLRAVNMAFSKVDLNTVLTSVLDDLQKPITETNAVISFGELPEIVADRNQIKQLFTNLLSNSIKFRKKDAAPKINIFAEDRGKEWLFVVEDNGIGIEPEFTKLIFDVFQRLSDREEYPGVGIGLAICKRIVERHAGSIWVESKVGKGSSFYFIIPKKESMVS